jgi:hypothetical protein
MEGRAGKFVASKTNPRKLRAGEAGEPDLSFQTRCGAGGRSVTKLLDALPKLGPSSARERQESSITQFSVRTSGISGSHTANFRHIRNQQP